ELERSSTQEQIRRFDLATNGLPGARSLCNSAGVLHWPAAHRDWARPGLMLYGVPPVADASVSLEPVMTFNSQVMAVRALRRGEALGYGATYVADRDRRVGLVCAGYADGYPQTAPTGTPIAVDGRRTSLLGRVSMDMLSVDLTDLPDAGLGSEVELWGRTIRVAEVAAACGRIPYGLVCHVRRAPVTDRGLEATTENKSLAGSDLQSSAG